MPRRSSLADVSSWEGRSAGRAPAGRASTTAVADGTSTAPAASTAIDATEAAAVTEATSATIAPVPSGEATAAAAPGHRSRSLAYNPSFDGLRGVAVAAVLAFHGGFTWAQGGYLGVSTFFTLSGFLITSLIVAEHRSAGRVDLRRFWARRVRRLLPASALTLLVVSLWALVADAGWERNLRGDVLASLFQVANWHFLLGDRSYGDLFAAPSPLLHFWSLAIEEQFYWLFPLLAAGVMRRTRAPLRALGATLAALLAGSAALMLVLGADEADAVYFATPTRMGEILAGALLAVVLASRGPVAPGRPAARWVAALGVAALAASAWAWWAVAQTDRGLYQGGLLVYAALSTAVVLACTVPGPVRTALAWWPLRLLGLVSYGVYLAHWPIFLWLDEARVGWSGVPLFAVRVAVTLLVAVASYLLVERPVRRGWRPSRIGLPMPALAVGAVAMVALVAAVVPAVSSPPAEPFAEGDTDLRSVDPSEVPDGATLALTLGDSTLMNVAIGLTIWGLGTEDGVVPVGGLGGLGCSIMRGGERRYAGEVGASPPYCDEWAERIPEITETVRDTYGRADIAILATGPWDLADHRLPGEDTWRSPGDPVYDAFLQGELEAATDAFLAEDLLVVWLTSPYLDVGRHMQPPPVEPFPESDPARVDLLNDVIRDIAASREGVAVVEYGAYVDGLSDAEEQGLRPDGVHVDRDAAEDLARDWLAREILVATTAAQGG